MISIMWRRGREETEKKKRQMTDKQREALAKNRFPSRKQSEEFSRDNNADETPYNP